jgi:hypothetical protein
VEDVEKAKETGEPPFRYCFLVDVFERTGGAYYRVASNR